jgi:hypothetical protein
MGLEIVSGHIFAEQMRSFLHCSLPILLLGLVERFRSARYPARKQVALDSPKSDHLAVPNCHQKCIPAKRVDFRFRRDLDNEHWLITESGGDAVIEMGEAGLCAIDRGAADMILGKGDWATSSGVNSLWFWGHPHSTTARHN